MAIEQPNLGGSDRAGQIVKESIVIDALNCIGLLRPPNWLSVVPRRDLVIDYWDRARQAGVTAMGVTRGIDPDYFLGDGWLYFASDRADLGCCSRGYWRANYT